MPLRDTRHPAAAHVITHGRDRGVRGEKGGDVVSTLSTYAPFEAYALTPGRAPAPPP